MNETQTREPSNRPSASSESTQAAQAIVWAGVALVGLFLINSVITILPPAFLQPEWQLSVALALQSNGLQALIGCALMSAAPLLDPGNLPLQKRTGRIRRIAAWICVGWLLLIPLQVFSGIQVLRQSQGAARLELRRIEQQIDQLRQAKDEQSFRVQFALMAPNSPPFPERLPASLERVRAEAVRQFVAQSSQQLSSLDREFNQRAQSFLIQSLRNSLLCLLLSVGFAAIGRWRSDGPTILSELLQWFDPEHPGSFSQRWKAALKTLRKRSGTLGPGGGGQGQSSTAASGPSWLAQLKRSLERLERRRRMARTKAESRASLRQAERKQAAARAKRRQRSS